MKNAGFTLVEVLVALVAGGLLLAALTSVVSGLSNDLTKTQAENGMTQIEAAAPILHRLIENAVPAEEASIIQPDKLELTVPPPQSLGPIGPLKMDLMVRRSGRGQGLFLAFNATSPSAEVPSAVRQWQLLVDGFDSIEITSEPAAGGSGQRLPSLIHISFIDGHQEPVALTFRPRISSTGACRFDAISMTCRA